MWLASPVSVAARSSPGVVAGGARGLVLLAVFQAMLSKKTSIGVFSLVDHHSFGYKRGREVRLDARSVS